MAKLHGKMQTNFDQLNLYQRDQDNHKQAVEELGFLLAFNSKVTVSVKRCIQDIMDAVFTDLANILLLRRDAYLEHLRLGVKPDTTTSLRLAPPHPTTLFEDSVIAKAEREISEYESRGPQVAKHERAFHPYKGGSWVQGN